MHPMNSVNFHKAWVDREKGHIIDGVESELPWGCSTPLFSFLFFCSPILGDLILENKYMYTCIYVCIYIYICIVYICT